MKKISKDALRIMLKKKEGWTLLPDNVKYLFLNVVHRHLTTGTWKNGKPIRIFRADGCYCIRYQNGMWWHYDLIRGTWF